MAFAPTYLDWNATTPLDPAVRDGIEALADAAEQAIRELSERTDREVEACTNPE